MMKKIFAIKSIYSYKKFPVGDRVYLSEQRARADYDLLLHNQYGSLDDEVSEQFSEYKIVTIDLLVDKDDIVEAASAKEQRMDND